MTFLNFWMLIGFFCSYYPLFAADINEILPQGVLELNLRSHESDIFSEFQNIDNIHTIKICDNQQMSPEKSNLATVLSTQPGLIERRSHISSILNMLLPSGSKSIDSKPGTPRINSDVQRITAGTEVFRNLKNIEIYTPMLKLSDFEQISTAIREGKYPQLNKLVLNYVNLNSEIVQKLQSALPTITLETLDLSFSKVSAQHLATLLGCTPHLHALHLRSISLDNHHFEAMATMIKSNKLNQLEILDLTNTEMTSQKFEHLVHALKNVSNIEQLNLDSNYLKDQDASNIATLLQLGTFIHLKKLLLSNNYITNPGYEALLNAFKSKNSINLEKIWLHNNHYEKASRHLHAALKDKNFLPNLKEISFDTRKTKEQVNSQIYETFEKSSRVIKNIKLCNQEIKSLTLYRKKKLLKNIQSYFKKKQPKYNCFLFLK